jgi:sugar/nucleoside kinase (ribokinase family)
MRLVSFGNLYLNYYMKNGIPDGVMVGKTSINILANLSNRYNTFYIGYCGNDSIGDIIIKSLNDLHISNLVKRIPKKSKCLFIDNKHITNVCPLCNRQIAYNEEYLKLSDILDNITNDDILIIDNLSDLTIDVLNNTSNLAIIDIAYEAYIKNKSLSELEELLTNRFTIINMNESVYNIFKEKFMLDSIDIYELFKPKLLIITKSIYGIEIVYEGISYDKIIEDPENIIDSNGVGDAFLSEFIDFILNNDDINDKTISRTYMKANFKSRIVLKRIGALTHIIPLYKITSYKNCICENLNID